MNCNWKRVREQVEQAWSRLTPSELDQINGDRRLLAGKLQEKYGFSKMEAESEIDSFLCEMTLETDDIP